MKYILEEMKTIFENVLNGATFIDIIESPEYEWLEMVMGEQEALVWYEMYIELATIEEIKEYLKLPVKWFKYAR